MTIITAPAPQRPGAETFRNFDLAAIVIVVLWLTAALWLSLAGAFDSGSGASAAAIPAAVLLPPLMFSAAIATSVRFRAWIDRIDLRAILLLHTWRMLGLGFLFVYAQGGLPGLFAYPAALGDAAVAAWATLIAYSLWRGRVVSKRQLILWNGFGLVDFAVAVTIGTLTGPGSIGVLDVAVTTQAMGVPPLSIIPTFVVPLLVITHIVVAVKLRGFGDRVSLSSN